MYMAHKVKLKEISYMNVVYEKKKLIKMYNIHLDLN